MLIYVPLSQIDDNPFQARQEYGDVAELASRIAAARDNYPDTFGLMQIPRGRLVVRNSLYPHGEPIKESFRVPENPEHWDKALKAQLAFGHRRLRAFRHLYETGAPGYEDGRFPIHVDALTDEQMLDAVWSENRERKDISAVEEAELLRRKLERAKSQREVAEAWGLDRSTVTNLLRLLDLPDDVKEANRDGRLTGRMIDAVARIYRVAPKSPLIDKVLKNPDGYSSDSIRYALKRNENMPHHYVRSPQPAVSIHAPSLRLSAIDPPMPEIGRAAMFACRQCQETAPVTEVICQECPLTTFLRRLGTEARKT